MLKIDTDPKPATASASAPASTPTRGAQAVDEAITRWINLFLARKARERELLPKRGAKVPPAPNGIDVNVQEMRLSIAEYEIGVWCGVVLDFACARFLDRFVV